MTVQIQGETSFGVSITSLRAGYPGKPVLEDLHLHLPLRQVSVILGPGGSGKTTLLKAIGDRTGEGFWWKGKIDSLAKSRATSQWQERDLSKAPLASWILPEQARPSLQQARDRVQRIWHEVPPAAASLLAALDGRGSRTESWHLSLARFTGTLAATSDLFLLDEPGFGLPPRALSWLATRMRATARTATVVLVTHNLALARQVGDFMVLIVDGEAIESATSEGFFDRPQRARTRHFIHLGC